MARFHCMLLVMASAAATFSPCPAERMPLVTKVEHFYLASDESEKLYNFFRDDLI